MAELPVRDGDDASTTGLALNFVSSLLADRVSVPGPLPVEAIDWQRVSTRSVVEVASAQRVSGLLLTAPAASLLPADLRAVLGARQRSAALRSMRQLADLARILPALTSSGVDTMVIKGLPLSAQLYGEWSIRGSSADIDLLIDPNDLTRADSILVAMGYVCHTDMGRATPLSGLRGRYNAWLHYERSYRHGTFSAIDLHWRPVPGSAPWTDFRIMWRDRLAVDIGGNQVAVPGAAAALRITCSQGESDGWPSLRAAVDALASAALVARPWPDTLASDSLVRDGVKHARQVIAAPGVWLTGRTRSAPISLVRRQWSLRRRTDTLPRAAARSLLGKWLPVRRISPTRR